MTVWPLIAGAAISAAGSIFGGRRQQAASNAQAAAQMQFERENMFHQNQVALDMSREQNAFNAAEAAKARDWNVSEAEVARKWNAGQAVEARDWSANQAGIERTFNAAEAAKNRDFQEMMSNTQYQRATRDMIAAGINPMLAVSQGGAGNVSGDSASASAPSTSAPQMGAAQGAQASGAAASPAGLARGASAQQFNYLASGLSTAAEIGGMIASVKNMQAQTEKTEVDTENSRAALRVMEELWKGRTDVDAKGNVIVHGPGVRYREENKRVTEELEKAVSEADRARYEARAAAELPARSKAERELKQLELPKAKADAEFQQMMMNMMKGGASSASGLERVIKLFVPLLMKGMGK